jgi:Raf kinase inhibitor-like YbhB/YbcL family protein
MKLLLFCGVLLPVVLIHAHAKGGTMPVSISSPAFGLHQPIPSQYTCDGKDISPPLALNAVPANTKSIVLICDDPDAPAGTWVHWVCYDIPPSATGISEDQPKADSLSCGGTQGKNDFHRIGWGGPCPPGGTHRYFFKVYCLDIVLNLLPGKTKKDIEKAMKGHVIDRGEFYGVYSRGR